MDKASASGSLPHFEEAFRRVGWFIPPYAAMGFLSSLAGQILSRNGEYREDDLEAALAPLYGPESLAAMVCSRYPVAPVISDYRETIAEAVEAHFMGLHHIAVGGLIPVVEGAGRELLRERGLPGKHICTVFSRLADDCKRESMEEQRGAVGEIASMMDSFSWFTQQVLYVDTGASPFLDGTNRHGILHGAYRDEHYGRPLNFFKAIGAVDFLTFVSSFRASISWLAPNPSATSQQLALYYRALERIRPIPPWGPQQPQEPPA